MRARSGERFDDCHDVGCPVSNAVRVEEVPERAKRRTYTAKYRAEILAEYDRLDRDGRGALMRREGPTAG